MQTPFGHVVSKPQGILGSKVLVEGIVILQDSYIVDTRIGRKYSHCHIIEDTEGNLYWYKGSKHFPKRNLVRFVATVQGYKQAQERGSIMTVLKAPKPA